MTEEIRDILDHKIEKISKYQNGDKFVIEIRESGYPYSIIGERHNCSEEFLDSLDRLDSDYINEHFGELQDEAYEQGLNDAWNLARRLEFDEIDGGYSIDECGKIFECSVYDVFKYYTPQEALAKLKAYEDSKIEVGDVVLIHDEILSVVTYVTNQNRIYGFDTLGMIIAEIPFSDCTKTGKHIDIQSILSQIGGV